MSKAKVWNLEEVKKELGLEGVDQGKSFVTPKIAKSLLRHCNKGNRRMSGAHVNSLKRDMESGNWFSDTDYIGFDKNGKLVNGQHRLKALSLCNPDLLLKHMNIVDGAYKLKEMTEKQKLSIAGITLKFDFNVEQHISMDTGKVRSYATQVAMSKKMDMEIMPSEFKTVITSGLKIFNEGSITTLSNSEWFNLWNLFSEDLTKAKELGVMDLNPKIKGSSSVKAALLWAYMSKELPKNEDSLKVLKHFVEVLKSGICKSDYDIPIIRLRDELFDLRGSGKAIDIKRAAYVQQALYNVLVVKTTTNRLPSNPVMHYCDWKPLESLNN